MKISHFESIREKILEIGKALDKKYSPYAKGNQYKLSKLLHRYSINDVIATAKYVNMKFKNTNYYEWARKPNIFLQDRFDEFYEEMKRKTPEFLKEITRKESKKYAETRNNQQKI